MSALEYILESSPEERNLMPKYTVAGSYEEFFEANIEAPDENTAIQIFYQNAGDMSVVDGNWVDIKIEDYLEDDEDVEYTMDNYKEEDGKIRV
jgi:hypothetical protein